MFIKRKRKTAVLKKIFIRLFKMDDKKRILILLKVLDKIQEDSENAR